MNIKNFYFSIILISSIIGGIIFAEQFKLLEPFTIIFLMLILFLAALKIDPKKIINSIDETKEQFTIFIATIFILIILPVTIYYITYLIFPPFAPAFFILSLAPTGVAVPFLTDLLKGNKGMALILTISTSLLAPITIPFLINIILGGEVYVDFIKMFISLIKIIFIPFISAWIIKYFFFQKINQISNQFNKMSTLLLGLLLATIIAIHSEAIFAITNREGLFYLIALSFLFLFIYLITWGVFYKTKERFTIIICSVFTNFVLMIVIANDFFYNYPEIIIPLILSIIPWTVSLIIIKQFKKKKIKKLNLLK